LGVVIGAVGGGVYWLAAQLWPTSIAVILAMLATALLAAAPGTSTRPGARTADVALVGFVFAVFVKYNALMALSAASVPFALPANLALGLIMIAGQACSRALVVSAKPASHTDLGIALAIGFAPAALIGVPGLIGLVGAIGARIVFMALIRRRRSATAADVEGTQQLTEICFYLGTLAARAYI
jgi:hypothetical protein